MKEKGKSKKNPFEGRKPRERRHKVTMAETALKLLAFYTVLNSGYKRGKLMVIRGDVSGQAKLVVNDPEDTGIDGINPYTDMDPVLFFYLGNNNKLRVVVCNIDTPLPSPSDVTPSGDPANPLTSTGRYTIYEIDQAASPQADGSLSLTEVVKDITLTYDDIPVAGNPHGFIRYGDYIYIIDYDTMAIYRVEVDDLETPPTDGNRPVDMAADASSLIQIGHYHHGVALLIAEDPVGGNICLFALFNDTEEDSNGFVQAQYDSTLVRYEIDAGTGELSNGESVVVGENCTGLHLYVYNGTPYLIIPAIGGKQKAGRTNGESSKLLVLQAFIPFTSQVDYDPDVPITGDPEADVSATGSYDIIDITFSEDGSNAYLRTFTYNHDPQNPDPDPDIGDYLTCRRDYKISSMDDLIAWAHNPDEDSYTLSEAVANNLLIPLEPAIFNEFWGYYHNIDYQDAGDGKLWDFDGYITVCAGDNYNDPDAKIIGDTLYGPGDVEINSSILVSDILYPPTGKAVHRRSHNARHRTLARSIKAAMRAARQAGGKTGGGADDELEDK
jgi:hypothetical protein